MGIFWDFSGDEMAIVFAGEVAGEEDFEAGDLDEVHCGTQDVASGVRSEADGGDGVGGVVVDGFDLVEGFEMFGFGVEGCSLVGGGREIPVGGQ